MDGVRITIEEGFEEIYSDERATFIPAEVIRLGQRATISLQLYKGDGTVLSTLIQKRSGGSTLGTIPNALGFGSFLFSGSLTSSVAIYGPVANQTWTFPRAWLAGSAEVSLNSRLIVWNLTFNAVPDASSPAVLYTIA